MIKQQLEVTELIFLNVIEYRLCDRYKEGEMIWKTAILYVRDVSQ